MISNKMFHKKGLDFKERKLARLAISYLKKEHARIVDLGCGAGSDSLYFSELGHSVLAIDINTDVIRERLRNLNNEISKRISVKIGDMNSVLIPDCDLLYSSLTLSFCRGRDFFEMWNHITNELNHGTLVCVDLFGEDDDWFPNEDRYFYNKSHYKKITREFNELLFNDVHYLGKAMNKDGEFIDKNWHRWIVLLEKK